MKLKKLNIFLESLESCEESTSNQDIDQYSEIKKLIKKNNLDPIQVKKFFSELKKLKNKNEECEDEINEANIPKISGVVGKIVEAMTLAGIVISELDPIELIHWIEVGEKVLHITN